MDGHSNAATLIDDRPGSRRNPWDGKACFRDQEGLDFIGWDDPRNAFSESCSPLSVAGFVRFGGLNRSSWKALNNPQRRGNSHQDDADLLPEPSFRPRQSDHLASGENGDAANSLANLAALSTLTVANTPPQFDTPGPTPEPGLGTIPIAKEEDLALERNVAAIAEPSPATSGQCPFQQLQDLSNKVKAGNDSAIAEIQKLLNSNDALWHQLGDVENTTEAMLIEACGGSAASRESVRRSVAAMRQSLLGEQPTPLQRMAVGRVVACWLFVNFVDRWSAWSIKQGGRGSSLAKLLEASEKRYQISLRSLKLVQRL